MSSARRNPAVPTLNIVGAGKLGRTMGRLWADSAIFRIQDVQNRSLDSAQAAVAFIGAGKPVAGTGFLRPADVTLIATPDDSIAACCNSLADSGLLRAGQIVFHCSGALSSTELVGAAAQGCATASVHPIHSFADPLASAGTFNDTWCGMEGEARALDCLGPAFESVGARLVAIAVEDKTLYHSAAVFASNYLVTMLDLALQTYMRAGIPRETALAMIAPLARGTVENVLLLGPEKALTGPVQRGDRITVEKHFRALQGWRRQLGALYQRLAHHTLALARRQKN